MNDDLSTGITGVVELYQGDYSPSEAAEWLAAIRIGIMPSDKAYGLLQRVHWLYRIAARMSSMADIEAADGLLQDARETLRRIALAWLENRGCACCVALRAKLINGESH